MGFRDDLDLSGFINKYQWALEGGPAPSTTDWTDYEPPPPPPKPDPTIPRQVGNGPAACSSSVALELVYPPTICWDVNGWYRSLGAHHRMTRKEIGQAYVEANGHESERLTWIVTALLDAEIKRAYDMVPLGDLYLNDPFIVERLKAIAMEMAKQSGIDPRRVLDDMGLTLVDSEPERPENSPQHLLDSESIEPENVFNRGEWAYSFWALNIESVDLWDYAQGEYWQEVLIAACARKDILTRLRVGVMRGDDPHRVHVVNGEPVVFVNRATQVNPTLADLAVAELSQYL